MSYATIEEISPKKRIALGIAMAVMGVVTAWIVHAHPERLRAPAWVAFAACFCFVVCGALVALYSLVSRKAYAWAMAGLLAAMTTVPVWIALGAGEKHCVFMANLPAATFPCRLVFGVSAVFMVGITVLAVILARKVKSAAYKSGPLKS